MTFKKIDIDITYNENNIIMIINELVYKDETCSGTHYPLAENRQKYDRNKYVKIQSDSGYSSITDWNICFEYYNIDSDCIYREKVIKLNEYKYKLSQTIKEIYNKYIRSLKGFAEIDKDIEIIVNGVKF